MQTSLAGKKDYVAKTIIFFAYTLIPFSVVSGFAVTPIQQLLLLLAVFTLHKAGQLKPVLSPHNYKYGNNLFTFAAVFFAWCFLSIFWSIKPMDSFRYFIAIKFVVFSILFLLAYKDKIISTESLQKISRILPLAFCIGAAFFMAEVYSGFTLKQLTRNIFSGGDAPPITINDFNKTACFFSLFMWAAVFSVATNDNGKTKWLKIVALISLGFIVITRLENSSSVLAMLAAIATFVFVLVTKSRANILIPLSIVIISVATLLMSIYMDPAKIIAKYPDIPPSAAHRLYIWDFAAEKAMDKPLLGWGLRGSRSIPGGKEPISISNMFDNREILPSHPHNSTLQIWLELGLVGVVLYLAMIFSAFVQINRSESLIFKAAANALLVNYIIIGMLSFDIWRIWWLSAGVLAFFYLSLVRTR